MSIRPSSCAHVLSQRLQVILQIGSRYVNLVLGCAAFGVPSESADASLLLAWLSRNMAMPAGCVLNMPPELPDSIAEHVAHLLQRLMKVRHTDEFI